MEERVQQLDNSIPLQRPNGMGSERTQRVECRGGVEDVKAYEESKEDRLVRRVVAFWVLPTHGELSFAHERIEDALDCAQLAIVFATPGSYRAHTQKTWRKRRENRQL